MAAVLASTEIRAENPLAASIWTPKFLPDRGAWICERQHYGERGDLRGLETWGAYATAQDGKRHFCVGYFPLETNAAAICEGLNDGLV